MLLGAMVHLAVELTLIFNAAYDRLMCKLLLLQCNFTEGVVSINSKTKNHVDRSRFRKVVSW